MTDTQKHTAGPWELSEGDTSIWAKSPLNARVRLADIIQHSSMNGIDNKANACLMAAAPELLAALELLVYDLENNGEVLGTDTKRIGVIEEAIAKAEGRVQ